MNATKRLARKRLAGAGVLALALALAGPAVAKSDKPYHEAPRDGSAAVWQEETEVAAEYIYYCRIGSAIKYRLEADDGDFLDLRSTPVGFRPAPRLGTCAS